MTHLERCAALPVRDVLRTPGPAAEELLRLAMGGRKTWTYAEWIKLVGELEDCDETVADWSAFRE